MLLNLKFKQAHVNPQYRRNFVAAASVKELKAKTADYLKPYRAKGKKYIVKINYTATIEVFEVINP